MPHLYEAVRIDPEDPGANFLLGLELADQGKYDEAITHLTKVIKKNPQNAPAHNAIGVLWGRQGNIEKAMNHFREAIRLNPGFPEAKRNLEEASIAIERRP
jgi:tetratricopeptide (TPR) repeat protein